MISKCRIKAVIETFAPLIIEELSIVSPIKFHIEHNKSKKYQQKTMQRCELRGVSFISSDYSADVVIFYDKHNSEKQVLSTLIHELLHVRLGKLVGLITISCAKGSIQEEKLVLNLEEIILRAYWDDKHGK